MRPTGSGIPIAEADPMNRWEARARPDSIGLYRYAVRGLGCDQWWKLFTHDLHAKIDAGQDVGLEIQEGRQLVQAVLGRSDATTLEVMQSDDLTAAMATGGPAAVRRAQCRP